MGYRCESPLIVYGIQRSSPSYWEDVAHLPGFRDYLTVHGADGFLLNGGRAAWEWKQYLLRQAAADSEEDSEDDRYLVLNDGKRLDRVFLKDALADGNLLDFYQHILDVTGSGYAAFAILS